MKKLFKETLGGKIVLGAARVADKLGTSGLVFNMIDKNNAPKGELDAQKSFRDFLVWIPLLVLLAQEIGLI